MFHVSLWGLTLVAAAAVAAPICSQAVPRIKIPAVVFEIVLGIVIGPSVLGWVRVDVPISVLSYFGLGFLFFVAGLETDARRVGGQMLRLAFGGWLVSVALAIGVGYILWAFGLVGAPVFVAIILASTSLGVITGIVKEQRLEGNDYGQFLLACSSIAEFGTVMVLSLFLTGETHDPTAQAVLVGFFVVAIVALLTGLEHVDAVRWFSEKLVELHDKTAQIRIRGSLLILVAVSALSVSLGLSPIIGAFLAGVIIRMAAPRHATAPVYQRKIEALGFGMFIPVFFVTSGLTFDLRALVHSPTAIVMVPILLAALLFVRGAPALLYAPKLGWPRARALGLLNATSISFIVPAANLGVELHRLSPAVGAALITTGLLSVIIFPPAAIPTLRGISSVGGLPARARLDAAAPEGAAPASVAEP